LWRHWTSLQLRIVKYCKATFTLCTSRVDACQKDARPVVHIHHRPSTPLRHVDVRCWIDVTVFIKKLDDELEEAAWHRATFIKWSQWTLAMTVPWRQHHKQSWNYYYYFSPQKTRVRKKIEKVKKNGEANVPSGRPTQNYCATKQNW